MCEVVVGHPGGVARRLCDACGVLGEELIPFGEVAGSMRWPEVLERGRAAFGDGHDVIDVQGAWLDDAPAQVALRSVQLEHGRSATIDEGSFGVASSMPAHLAPSAPWVAALPRLRVPTRPFGLGRVEVAGYGRRGATHRRSDRGERRTFGAHLARALESPRIHVPGVGPLACDVEHVEIRQGTTKMGDITDHQRDARILLLTRIMHLSTSANPEGVHHLAQAFALLEANATVAASPR